MISHHLVRQEKLVHKERVRNGEQNLFINNAHALFFYFCQMKNTENKMAKWKSLTLRLLTVFAVFIICKIGFALFNLDTFKTDAENLGFSYWVRLIWGVIRYDLVAISFINLLYIFLSLLPFRFVYNAKYKSIVSILTFYIPNIAAFSFDFIDIIYSRFTQRRMTFDVFKFVRNEEGVAKLIPEFLKDYWYILVIYIVIVTLFIFINRRIAQKEMTHNPRFSAWSTSLTLIIFLSLGVLGTRGGFQLRPLSVVNVSSYAIPQHYMLVLNSPFTLIKSIGKDGLESKSYFSEEEVSKIYPTIWHSKEESESSQRNIVILILESFSLEFSKTLNPQREKSLTPHLDSIGSMGIMIPFYANGTRSMEGIPAIIAGMPTWMDSEYLSSPYAGNKIAALPSLLKRQGYHSAFFHGGKNGTMNFYAFTQLAGFDRYYGKNEYGNDADYDGNWGIFDDRYLPYCAKEISKLDTPFLTSIFTLSSHHPYTLPDDYQKEHPGKGRSMPESIEYADWALGKFFAEAARQPWFSNTIFIITADHAAQSEDPYYKTRHARHSIPFIIFDPQNQIDTIRKTFGQQIDILPTILDLIHYPKDCFAFGHSLFDDQMPFAINFQNGIYQMITDEHLSLFDGVDLTGYYNWREDPFLKNNMKSIANDHNYELMWMKSVIQQYNNRLIQNRLTIE